MMLAGALAAAGRIELRAGASPFPSPRRSSPTSLWFWAGRRYGYPVLRFLCRISLSPDTCVRQTEGIFERWGFFSVVVSKFVPGFATVAPPIAGALKMRFGAFVAASTASAALWAGAAMVAGCAVRAPDRGCARMDDGASRARRTASLPSLVGAYVVVKGCAALADGALLRPRVMISIDELRERLAVEPRPFIIDIGSRLAHQCASAHPAAPCCSISTRSRASTIFRATATSCIYCACPNEESAQAGRADPDARRATGGCGRWSAASTRGSSAGLSGRARRRR